jgi:hypothetical protein
MGQAAISNDDEQHALDQRVESLLAAHSGDARAVIEVLLMAADQRAERISFGYVRGRLPTCLDQP